MWINDKQTGVGSKVWIEGDRYVGNWDNNRRYGYGVYTWPSGSMYDGYWKTVMHGYGCYVWYDGRVYEGEWNNGCMQGRGVFKFPDGCLYDGEWRNQKRHGHGVMYWHDSHWEGSWLDDLRQDSEDDRAWDRFFTLNITGQKEFVKAYMRVWDKNYKEVTGSDIVLSTIIEAKQNAIERSKDKNT